jgi:serine/threonine-protein kinase RsbW
MPGTATPEVITVRIPSRLELLALLDGVTTSVCDRLSVDENTASLISMSVIEAGTNAIQHGNCFAAEKTVEFDFHVYPKEILIEVEDFGTGFDPGVVDDPTDDSTLLNPHGRGLYLMRELMDEVAFDLREDHGTRVRLRKLRVSETG